MDEQTRHGSPSTDVELQSTQRVPPPDLTPPTSVGGRPLVGAPARTSTAIGSSPLIGPPVAPPSSSTSGGHGAMSPELKSYVQQKTTLTFPCLVLGSTGQITVNPQLASGTLSNSTLQRQYGDVSLIKVQLPKAPARNEPPRDVAALLRTPVSWAGKQYRLDLFDTGDATQAWGVSTEDAARIAQVPADEWNEYARQGLFSEAVTGAAGSFRIRLAPIGTGFAVKGGAALEVNDGFGFIRASVAETMGVTTSGVKPSLQRQIPSTQRGLEKPAHPNTQMLQWLKEDNAVVAELVERAVVALENQLGNAQRSTEHVYRAATTGDFPVRYGTAVPVPGKNVVLSIDVGDGDRRVALHRAPADKPNWTQGELEPATTPLAKSIRELTAFQYRLQQKPEGERPMLMMKGLLGVIGDEAWPDAFGSQDIVGCVTDCKVDSAWTSEAEVNEAKKAEQPRDLTLEGNMAITKILAPGSLVGVPAPMMKQMSGDYDGDAVHILQASDCPMLFDRLGELDQRMNPKLTKHIGLQPPSAEPPTEGSEPAPPRSMANRLAEIRDADGIVGQWSTVADILCTINPTSLGALRPQIATLARLPLADDAALWELVGLGIKAGTDLPKTNLSGLEFHGIKLDAARLLQSGTDINRFLRRQGHDNPHARKNKDDIASDLTSGVPIAGRDKMKPAHYGVPGRIMRAVNEYMRIKWEQSMGFNAPLAPLFAPGEPTIRRAEALFEAAAETDASDASGVETAARALVGKLIDLFDSRTRNASRNRDADRWTLAALSVVHVSELQRRCAPLDGLTGVQLEAAATRVLGDIVEELATAFRNYVGGALIQPGAVLSGAVQNANQHGVFVELDYGITGRIAPNRVRGFATLPGTAVTVRVRSVRSEDARDLVDLELA